MLHARVLVGTMVVPVQAWRVADCLVFKAGMHRSLQVRSNDDLGAGRQRRASGRASMDGAVLPRQTSNFDFYLQHRRPSQSNLSEAERWEAASFKQCSLVQQPHVTCSAHRQQHCEQDCPHHLLACVAVVVALSEQLSNGLALRCSHALPHLPLRRESPFSSSRLLRAPKQTVSLTFAGRRSVHVRTGTERALL